MKRAHWLVDWIRENHITSIEEAAALLPKYRVLDALRQKAETGQAELQASATEISEQSIVSGAGVDLWGGDAAACPAPACMRKQVDELFRHVWHYFDEVVVADVVSPLLLSDGLRSKKKLIGTILQQIVPLLYLEEIGATDLVRFFPKHLCRNWEEHAKEQGLVVDSRNKMIEKLMERASFTSETRGKQKWLTMHLPEERMSTSLPVSSLEETTVKFHLANIVYTETMAHLAADVLAAHRLRLPLGAVRGVAGRMLTESRPVSVADVIFHLNLPVLEGIPAAELMKFREDHTDEFANFRRSLTRAAQERIKVTPTKAVATIAKEIQSDFIEPELSKIRIALAATEKSLKKKATVGMFLGALSTTCGLLAGVTAPLAISAGVATATALTGSAALKMADEQRETSLSDMYFLWRATDHAH